jgi:predicted aldo/keto reductase-like oxidoreductase
MPKVRLGRTEIVSEKNAFGALPIQRVDKQEAAKILLRALDGGITYFDTARGYTDSEEKIAYAMSDRRPQFHLATKTKATTADAFWKDLHTSLETLKTDYIDVFQFHNPKFCPKPEDGSGLYEGMLQAKAQGKIRFIGMTNHRLPVAREAVESGLYDTLQFPFSYLAAEADEALVRLCKTCDVGFICMKALSGGLITDYRAAYAYQTQFDNSLPIWGIQRMIELEQFLSCTDNPPVLDDELRAVIAKDRKELSGDFCRGCGYCLPCPANINIPMSARIRFSMTRQPTSRTLNEKTREEMERIENCIECRHCAEHCPYGLDTPAILRESLAFYREFLQSL